MSMTVQRIYRLKRVISLEDAPQALHDEVDRLLPTFDRRPWTKATRADLHIAISALMHKHGVDCLFKLSIGPRLVTWASRSQVMVVKTLATHCPEDVEEWLWAYYGA